ncbi:MAG: tRNA (adenosine(37)-N6)-threonylcarbamoyltransferase complex ATPase subunit type 1 TsaE [Acidaminococcaceae bacterium]
MKTIYCANSEATAKLGRALGAVLGAGDVVCLRGELGAGKTLFAKGIALAQGVAEAEVTSPTFAIMNIYQGRELELRHFDLYRLNSGEELEDIGFEEYVGGSGLTLIEWAELFPAYLPEEFLQVTIEVAAVGRQIVLEPQGRHYEELCEKV